MRFPSEGLKVDQTIFNIVAGAVAAGVSWWVNTIWSMVRSLQSQVTDLNVELAKNYVPRAELQATLDRISDKLDEIHREMRK